MSVLLLPKVQSKYIYRYLLFGLHDRGLWLNSVLLDVLPPYVCGIKQNSEENSDVVHGHHARTKESTQAGCESLI